jgi:hypothetical protein
MIKEMAFGVADRCHLVDVSKTSEWQNINRDTFVSLYDYDEYVRMD